MSEPTASALNAAPSSDHLRVMEIPSNGIGLGEGHWLRLTELEAWLRAKGHPDIADLVHEQTVNGDEKSRRPVKVQGV